MPKNSGLEPLNQDIANAIDEYLTENEKSVCAVTSKPGQTFFQPARVQMIANTLLLQVMRGEQDKAEKILKIKPELMLMTGIATDYSGRTFETTAFRYALWALDTRYMCNMMLDCLPCSGQGEAIKQVLLTQFREQSKDGLYYKLNGKTIHGVHYDFSPLIIALQTYIRNHQHWYTTDNWDALEKQWKVVGLAQRDVPAHVAQHYCDPDESFGCLSPHGFSKEKFRRSLECSAGYSDSLTFWFSLDPSHDPLGFGCGFFRGGVAEKPMIGNGCEGLMYQATDDLASMKTLSQVRRADLLALIQRLENPPKASCIIS